jgi:hypothetical protein
MIPTMMGPMMPARKTIDDNHSARERKKKNEIRTRIRTTVEWISDHGR